MPGLIPEFTIGDVYKKIDKFKKERIRKIFETLSYVGINAVKYAKQYHGYRDQTGNLTSSIGYAIIFNGKIESTYGGGTAKVVEELTRTFPTGMILVVVAGMEYAAAVESKGYDVITGSSLYAETELLPSLIKALQEQGII